MFGLHVLDLLVILFYFIALVVIGVIISKKIKNEDDFLVGGRGFGKLLQTFMNFGMATSADAPVGASREAFRQGMSGIWIQLLSLFCTPFYWITTIWQRRLRMSSMGEFYGLRFENRAMEMFFSFVGILGIVAITAVGMVSLQKTVEVMIPKAESQLSIEEQQIIENFHEMKSLENTMEDRSLTEAELGRYDQLVSLKEQGKVKSQISAIDPALVLVVMAVILLFYTTAGGIMAAAITDLLQGLLMIVLSIILLPFGLAKIGGFTGLHEIVPKNYFEIFSSNASSEYTWYYVLALVVMVTMNTETSPFNMQIFGSAKDEETARMGRINGLIMKRMTVILWGFTGLIGLALFKNSISDPDMLWGHMTRELLMPGLVGLMIVCFLAALQSSVSAFMVSTGALVTKNLYQPLFPNRSEKEYMLVSRISSSSMLVLAILITLYFNNFLSLLRLCWDIGFVYAPVFWVAIFWRKLTTKASWTAIIYTFVFTLLVVNFAENIPFLAKSEFLTRRTEAYTVQIETSAVEKDVADGRAAEIGQMINKDVQIPPIGVFFDTVVKENPNDPNSPWIGKGRMMFSLLFPAALGVDFSHFKRSDLLALMYALNILIPLILLIVVSLFTKKNSEAALNEFYGRLQTPVRGSHEDDDREMALTRKDPDRFKHTKIFPNSSFEMLKPTKRDTIGFILVWAGVGAVILFLMGLTGIGA